VTQHHKAAKAPHKLLRRTHQTPNHLQELVPGHLHVLKQCRSWGLLAVRLILLRYPPAHCAASCKHRGPDTRACPAVCLESSAACAQHLASCFRTCPEFTSVSLQWEHEAACKVSERYWYVPRQRERLSIGPWTTDQECHVTNDGSNAGANSTRRHTPNNAVAYNKNQGIVQSRDQGWYTGVHAGPDGVVQVFSRATGGPSARTPLLYHQTPPSGQTWQPPAAAAASPAHSAGQGEPSAGGDHCHFRTLCHLLAHAVIRRQPRR
jgi:hypothetical protein